MLSVRRFAVGGTVLAVIAGMPILSGCDGIIGIQDIVGADAGEGGASDATVDQTQSVDSSPHADSSPLVDSSPVQASDASDGGAIGSACGAGSVCASGLFCVDGFCCESACNGQCQACDVPGSLGQCTAVTGAPHGMRAACTGATGAACTGTCAAGNVDGCTYPGSSTNCSAASCSNGVQTLAAACNGAGACPTASTVTCNPATCNAGGTACSNACNNDTQCTGSTPYCNGGACLSTKADGETCSASTECTNHNCVDGYCCNSACTETCQACDITGSQGACTQVGSGQPHGGRGGCTGAGTTCGGSCTSQSATQCTFPAGPCGTASCVGNMMTPVGSCSNGMCQAGTQTACPNGYECNASTGMCNTGCGSDNDCLGTDYCAANGQCTSQKTQGQACNAVAGGDCTQNGCRECGSPGGCVNGYCCNTSCAACQACNVSGSQGTCTAAPSLNGSGCGSGGTCSNGSCLNCTSPQVACNGSCVSLGTAANCLSCGNACSVGVSCTASGCIVDYGYTSSTGDGELDLISGIVHAEQITVSQPINVTQIGMILLAGTGSGILLLYQEDASGTLQLLAATASTAVTGGQNLWPVTSPVSIAAGNYWVAVELQNADRAYDDATAKIPTVSVDFVSYGLNNLPTMNVPTPPAVQNAWPLWVVGAETQ